MSLEIENYIEAQYRKIFDGTLYEETDQEFANLYENVGHERLKRIFTILHSEFNEEFKTLNQRLPTGDEEAHFWADPSRELIYRIEIVRGLQRNLAETQYAFDLDEYYETVISDCESWLSASGGSKIPPHHQEVTLYYLKPIFILRNAVPYNSVFHSLGTQGEILGRGGFSEVYKYHHPTVDIDFAVKILRPVFSSENDREEWEHRFFREAKMLFSLSHPNIVKIYDVGWLYDTPFIKMEFIDGMTLNEVIGRYSLLPFENAGRATLQILSGVQYAHERGIIHRDLKPSNVIACKDGWICKIIDFGVSAYLETEGYTRLTRTGEHVAGGLYIDPELNQNPSLRDVRSDIYSIGAILYFLLSGRAPGPDAEEYLRKANEKLTDLQVRIVMKALATELDSRYSSCKEMKIAIQEELDNISLNEVRDNEY